MNWNELATGIAAQLPVAAHGDDWLGVRWVYPHAPREQTQRLQLVDSKSSGVLVLVLCDLGALATVASARLLEMNMSMRRGAAAVYRGRGVLRHAEPLDGLAIDSLVSTARYLAETARRFRRTLISDGEVHGHFAE